MPETFINCNLIMSLYENECTIRVRYGETDQMSYVYYGMYAQYYEVGRVEMIRSLNLTYKSFEEGGIIMPVLELKCKYIKPARYDDLLTIKTVLTTPPSSRIHFIYQIYNEKKDLLNIGETTLVFVNLSSGKPCPPPDILMAALKPYLTP